MALQANHIDNRPFLQHENFLFETLYHLEDLQLPRSMPSDDSVVTLLRDFIDRVYGDIDGFEAVKWEEWNRRRAIFQQYGIRNADHTVNTGI